MLIKNSEMYQKERRCDFCSQYF